MGKKWWDNDSSQKYTTIAVYAVLVILFSVFCIFFFLTYSDFGGYITKVISVFSPIILGIIFAYLLNPMMRMFEKRVFVFFKSKKHGKHLQRAFSLICTLIVALAAVMGFVLILVPQIRNGYNDLVANMGGYVNRVQKWFNDIAASSSVLSGVVQSVIDYLNNLLSETGNLINIVAPSIKDFALKLFTGVKNVVFGVIFAIYFLATKERLAAQIKKIRTAVFSEKNNSRTDRFFRLVNESFGRFISSKLFDSLIIGVLCFILTWIIDIPYYPLVSLIIGLTNVIPIFGPYIGGILCVFIVFIANPVKALWFTVIVIILQLFDGNYLWPKLYGKSIGFPSVWVFVSIIVMSGFFGFVGMLFGAPVLAVVYALIKQHSEKKLVARGLSADTSGYISGEDGVMLEAEREAGVAGSSELIKKLSGTKLGKRVSVFTDKIKSRFVKDKDIRNAAADDESSASGKEEEEASEKPGKPEVRD